MQAIDDAPRWSTVFRWWVQAPPGGWPKVPIGFLDVPPVERGVVKPADRGVVEELMHLSDEEFAAVFASLA
jgi:hypothetical protein